MWNSSDPLKAGYWEIGRAECAATYGATTGLSDIGNAGASHVVQVPQPSFWTSGIACLYFESLQAAVAGTGDPAAPEERHVAYAPNKPDR